MTRTLFNGGWSFALKNIGETPNACDYRPVDIPHDWLVHDTHRLYADGDGCYKKNFTAHDISGKYYTLRFEGVYMDSEIFLNGEKIYEWKYGYTTFDVPLTNLKEGDNEIRVVVHHKSPNTRWYSGAGIFRNIWLTIKGENEIIPDGTYVVPILEDGKWRLEIDTEVKGNANASVKHTLVAQCGKIKAEASCNVALSSDVTVVSQTLDVENPKLWDVDNPYCYILTTELIVDGETVDERVENVGFKTTRWDENEGFFLNGKNIKIFGVCMHHDLGALGSAVNKTALRRQFESLKEMGVNSIRTSHNPPSVELMELADEMGIIINSEAFDMWEFKKTDYDYARFFPEWHERDVASWVRRDRNHPSMIMWSIGNEIYDTHAGPRGVEVTKMLRDAVRVHDYKRMYPVTI
ncbi:MAG: glycoside hydrolase family 2, partial [Oscillospiraceae bacterium]|nr:glycoside hydrolase family 2 [Oscillospiraceae bacterium]